MMSGDEEFEVSRFGLKSIKRILRIATDKTNFSFLALMSWLLESLGASKIASNL